jgi:hypothetical protein
LATVGLIQTADTGQIDWTTVTMGGSGVDGYEIWRFNDALQASAPVFMKIGYGNANLTTVPGVYLQVGTGSDGSGNLTGLTTTGFNKTGYTNSGGDTVPRVCSMAYNGGSFSFIGFANTVGSNPQMFMAVSRPYTSAGVYSASGLQTYRFGDGSYAVLTTQALNFVTSTALTADVYGNYSFVPGVLASTLVGVDPQIYAHWASLPDTVIIPGMATVVSSDVGVNTTFSLAVAGSTARTYLRIPSTWYGQFGPNAFTVTALAMIFE